MDLFSPESARVIAGSVLLVLSLLILTRSKY
jgi:hypothetical protein